MPAHGSTDATAARLELLASSELVIEGRMPWSSNATFLCELVAPGSHATEPGAAECLGRAIYKPHRGERPLWDFPDGLYRREAAAFELARAIGWDLVPPTIVRDGPFGPGSVQWFIEADFEQHHFTLVEDSRYHPQLMRLCTFDLVANSTDRKAGHVLVDTDDHLWGIDNGLCLHAEFKLRTVIWEFAHEEVPADLVDDLGAFLDRPLPPALCELIDPLERDALATRARAVVTEGRFPVDHTGRRVPWPLV